MYQLEHPGSEIGPLNPGGRRDWFEFGRNLVERLHVMRPDMKSLVAQASMYHASQAELYEAMDTKKNRVEPCRWCAFAVFCKSEDFTCAAFRAYVADPHRELRMVYRVPDKKWLRSFQEEKQDA